MKAKRYTDKEKQELIQKVDELRAGGMQRIDAIKQVGVAVASYSVWKRRFPTTPEIVIHNEEPKRTYKKKEKPQQASTSKCVVIVTDTQSLSQVLRGLT